MHQSSSKIKIWFFQIHFLWRVKHGWKLWGCFMWQGELEHQNIRSFQAAPRSPLCTAQFRAAHLCPLSLPATQPAAGRTWEMAVPRLPNWSFLHREGSPSLIHLFASHSFSCASESICIHPGGGVRKCEALSDPWAVPLGPLSVLVCFIEVLHHETNSCRLLQILRTDPWVWWGWEFLGEMLWKKTSHKKYLHHKLSSFWGIKFISD